MVLGDVDVRCTDEDTLGRPIEFITHLLRAIDDQLVAKKLGEFQLFVDDSPGPGCASELRTTNLGRTRMASTPTATLHVLGALRVYCGGAEQLPVLAPTVRAALEDLERHHAALYRNVCDETGAVRRHLNVFVNADNVRDLNGVDTALKAGDVLTILPAVSGG